MKQNRNSKRASIKFDDTEAFALVTGMWQDLEGSLPQDLYNHVLGRFRRRDYEFVVESFPSFGVSLMQNPAEGGVVLLNGKMFSMGENPQKTAELVYVVSHFLKKYEFESSDVYTKEYRARTARSSFRKAEKWCYVVNRHLDIPTDGPVNLLAEIKRTARWLLGDDPDVDDVISHGYFGPGVNVGVTGDQTDAMWKFTLPLSITEGLRTQFSIAARSMPATCFHYGMRAYLDGTSNVPPPAPLGFPSVTADGSEYARFVARGAMDIFYRYLKVVRGSRVAFVPKDSKTERAIACEPMVNSYFQNGCGALLVKRLARKTPMLDLRDQTRNRQMALAGSHTGSLATIDLSSASDTISKSLAKAILPLKWYRLLRFLRSPYYELDGVVRKSHKLSSMGNGFTFPIESILFYSIARAACVKFLVEERNLSLEDARCATESHRGKSQGIYEPSVYGDDIVVQSCAFNAVCDALKRCGFWINRRKSYSVGLFRESCGYDYYGGDYVRPIFLRRKISMITQAITLINQLTHPEGLGWLTERWGIIFPNLFRIIASFTHRFRGLSTAFGPFEGRVEEGFVSVTIDQLRSRGHVLWDPDGQRWVYKPIVAYTVLQKTPNEYGYALKALHRLERFGSEVLGPRESTAISGSATYALVVRGLSKLRYPSERTIAKGLASFPSVELGEVPDNLDRWLANQARYMSYYPLLKGW
jgi:hypothetical protein